MTEREKLEATIERLEELLEFNPTGLPAVAIATEILRLERRLEELEKEGK
jgi:hypothetical protein